MSGRARPTKARARRLSEASAWSVFKSPDGEVRTRSKLGKTTKQKQDEVKEYWLDMSRNPGKTKASVYSRLKRKYRNYLKKHAVKEEDPIIDRDDEILDALDNRDSEKPSE